MVSSKQNKLEGPDKTDKIKKIIPFRNWKSKDHTACLLSYRHFAVLGAMLDH